MSKRLQHIDLARGLIIAFMALDHAGYFISRRHAVEHWGAALSTYDGQGLHFLTRLITHLCAPGFCFLMGTSMALMAAKRAPEGWGLTQQVRYFTARGALLLLIQHPENIAWLLGELSASGAIDVYGAGARPGTDSGPLVLHFGVLTMLGGAMILWAPLLQVRSMIVAVLSAAMLLLPLLLLPDVADAEHHPVLRLLLLPGRTGAMQVLYPLLPWAGVAGLGVLYGRALSRDASRSWRWPAVASAVALAAFVAVRLSGGLGNLHAPAEAGWIGLLNTTKYPPSWAFLAMSLGAFWLLLAALDRWQPRVGRDHVVVVFGQTAMGFYLAHLFLYAALSFAFPDGAGLGVRYGVWLLSLAPLYGFCRWWRTFKSSKPRGSVWRML